MKNWYYELFKYLYDHYDISSGPSLKNFVAPRISPKNKLTDIQHIKAMLNDLEKRGIITWKADIETTNQDGIKSFHWLNIPKYKKDLGKDDNHTFDTILVEAHLTPDIGLEYVANILNREGTALTNRRIKNLTIILVIIGVVTILVQGLQCGISRQQLKQSQQTATPLANKVKDTSQAIIKTIGDSANILLSNPTKTKQGDTLTFKHTPVDTKSKRQ